jgi:hypothetical protein
LPKTALGKTGPDPAEAVARQEELAKKAIWAAAAVFGLLIVYMIAGRLLAVVTRWPTTVMAPVASSHCAQFIDLAKLAYGENWRVRLDPRDTTCELQVKTEWERQQLTRYRPPPQSIFGAAPAEPVALGPRERERPAPQTKCLNVVSLAKTKYGAEWRSKLTGEDAVCAGEPASAVPAVAAAPPDASATPSSGSSESVVTVPSPPAVPATQSASAPVEPAAEAPASPPQSE